MSDKLVENLRKCEWYGGEYFFHKWVEDADTIRHPEDPQKDLCYTRTYALVENVLTGQVLIVNAATIRFVK